MKRDPATTLTVVGYDDWYALYYGEEMLTEGHTIEVWDLAQVINDPSRPVTYLDERGSERTYSWLMDTGRFDGIPLSEVPE